MDGEEEEEEEEVYKGQEKRDRELKSVEE